MRPATDQGERIIQAAGGKLPQDRRELFARFGANVLHGVGTHPAGGADLLARLLLEAFEWTAERQPGEIRLRVRNPDDRPGHTVLEILQDDHPFIVDTIHLVLERLGVQERVAIHPILRVKRDEAGRLAGIESDPTSEAGQRESYVYIECAPRLTGEQLGALERGVREAMGWSRDVTDDHRRMIRAMRELLANLEYAGPALEGGPERAARIQSFLSWLVDGRFVFVGMRRYRVTQVDGEREVQIVPGTGLGMWRDDASSRLAEPQRGDGIPDDLRDELDDPRIILMSKSRMESRIHRHGRLDRLTVKEHDSEGRVTGFMIVVGLFTLTVLRTPGSQIPLLSARLAEVLERMGVTRGAHDHKAVVTAFDSLPIELVVAAPPDELEGLLRDLLEVTGSKLARLILRTHPHGRTLYTAVVLPREHYREDLRVGIRRLLGQRTGASYFDDRTTLVDEGTAVVHCFSTAAEGHRLEPDEAALAEEIRALCSPWEDQLDEALRRRFGEASAPELAARYENAFPEALRARTQPLDAVRDVEALEALAATGRPQFTFYFDDGDDERATATLRMVLAEPPLLSDVMQVADRFGVRVVDAQLSVVEPAGRPAAAIESLRILPLGADQADLDAIAPRLAEALAAAFTGEVPSDELNALVLGAGLDWRQVDCLRAYLEYFMQIQSTLSRPFLRGVLLENPLAVRVLVQYFEALHDPALAEDERSERVHSLRDSFERYRDRIAALNEDRALLAFFDLIGATLRTNFFAPRREPHRIVFKIEPQAVGGLTGVVPYREIFVHSTEMMGIHLRGGPVARGGLRWSDRTEDVRVEVLGLMTTQMLKNGLIVPVGAKGGFVLRRAGLASGEARAAADAQYRVFIASLLDVTDNLAPDGGVIPPEGVRCPDGDDPYLVVAADKGTAHLSDTANEIAQERGFWLGDAFASGGSEGYDHKKYGITARGAWECVKHHFADAGIDPEQDTYTVAGIGDMSGDVFGNGLLLARRARLLAAFDHRHIFLDPDPDVDAAWQERKRLFELPRSSWADYAEELLSPGGGVHPRSAKSIPVPEALRERLGTDAQELTGQELVHAILAMEVDLLWNGGIGTYVKASHETHADVGDRANDPVRIDATELRARIVGEGGNLGLTQAARVEAALRRVRLDTDAIDNSAGVDLSDHEVNYKIALAPLVRSGAIDAEQRRELLFGVDEVACESVLSHSRSQAQALSLDELRSQRSPESFLLAIESLCEFAQVPPSELGLPDAAAVSERAGAGIGLTRPELAVLLGLAKLRAQAELTASDVPQHEYLGALYGTYFPERFRDELADSLATHRLRSEITGLCLVNRLIDTGGSALFSTLTAELGVGVPEIASALLVAEDVLGAPGYRRSLLEHPGVPRNVVYAALVALDEGVREAARYLVRSGHAALDTDRIGRWSAAFEVLRSALGDYLSPSETQQLEARRERLLEQGLPPELATDVAGIPLVDRGFNIMPVCERAPVAPIDAARTYARLGEQTGINWVYARLTQADARALWDRLALVEMRWELLDLQRHITETVLESRPDDLEAGVRDFLAAHAETLARVQELQRRAATHTTPSALAVVTARLRSLRA